MEALWFRLEASTGFSSLKKVFPLQLKRRVWGRLEHFFSQHNQIDFIFLLWEGKWPRGRRLQTPPGLPPNLTCRKSSRPLRCWITSRRQRTLRRCLRPGVRIGARRSVREARRPVPGQAGRRAQPWTCAAAAEAGPGARRPGRGRNLWSGSERCGG